MQLSTQSRDTYLHADQSWHLNFKKCQLKTYLYYTFKMIKILQLIV